MKEFKFNEQNVETNVIVHIYDVTLPVSIEKAYKKLASLQKKSNSFKSYNQIEQKNWKFILVCAGGDGTLITVLMKAKDVGINISNFLCVSLPYGTGNDFCRVTNWGILPEARFYSTLELTVKEICFNTHEEKVDVWDVLV
jgi:diacylglycerol kinase family enzyme